jgi:hypothetical protein
MKTRLNEETGAHQVSATPSADAHTTEAAVPKAISPKGRILALAHDQNLSESFGAVLYLVAVMDSGKPLVPNSEEERLSWVGYRRGHLSALLCMAMHEQQCVPTAAAILVSSLLDQARAILCTSRPEGEA